MNRITRKRQFVNNAKTTLKLKKIDINFDSLGVINEVKLSNEERIIQPIKYYVDKLF